MSEIRAKFTRGREVMYISHLDMMRTFERAVRRSGIKIAYSQGFNPHSQIIFGLPLSVGVTSEAEYADFQLENDIDTGEFTDRLNTCLPEGIRILKAARKTSKNNIMASIVRAAYKIRVLTEREKGITSIEGIVGSFLGSGEIMVEKEGKGGIREINIRPMIYEMSLLGSADREDGAAGNTYDFSADLSAGSSSNLKPELLIKALCSYAGITFDYALIHRTALFVQDKGVVIDPLDERALS